MTTPTVLARGLARYLRASTSEAAGWWGSFRASGHCARQALQSNCSSTIVASSPSLLQGAATSSGFCTSCSSNVISSSNSSWISCSTSSKWPWQQHPAIFSGRGVFAHGSAELHQSHPSQQQQQRSLFAARVKHKPNYQDHNQKKPPKIKLKTPSAAKRRFIMDAQGVLWRRQANRGSKRALKNHRQLHDLKAMVPVHSSLASKLRKMGFKKRWWFRLKA